MNRRTFVFTTIGTLTALPKLAQAEVQPFYQVPPLPYPYNALEPHIDQRTMEFHHDRHHAAYVNNLNKTLAAYPDLQNRCLVELLQNLDQLPAASQTSIRNNGGGHLNHSLFWEIMSPQGGGAPQGAIGEAIDDQFGSFSQFQNAFEQAGLSLFGSGWVWLVKNNDRLEIMTTPNQDSPLMDKKIPIVGNDIWEHAYYLSYQNRRADYLKSWWNVVDWAEISLRFENA